jgi:hypothetical protein
MRNAGGYATWQDSSGKTIECDTFTCGHCGQVKHVMHMHKQDPSTIGGLCYQCMKNICPKCLATGRCDPFEEKLKRMESRIDARRSYEETWR